MNRATLSGLTRGRLAAVLALLGLAALAGGYIRFRAPDLSRVMSPAAPLSANTPATMFVQPDFRQLPASDRDFVSRGHYTVIVYHQKTCPDCQRLDRDLVRFLAIRKDVAVRKIDLGERWSTASALREYGRNIGWTPYVVIYGADGREISVDDGPERHASRLLAAWIKAESGKSRAGGASG